MVNLNTNKYDVSKLERIYEKYKKTMYKEAYNILYDAGDAEDAVQQAFVKIIGHLDKINEDEPGMTCNFLKIVVRNIAIDIYKKRLYLNSTDDIVDTLDDVIPAGTKEVSEIVIEKETVELIAKEIEKLPEIYRDVLLLERVYGYSREESMQLLGASYDTLKKRMTRGKKKLLEALRKEGLNDGREVIGKNAK